MSDVSQRDREFDLVVWGATGFTGRLVAEYILSRYGTGKDLRWAIGGRDAGRLASVRENLGAGAADVPILTGDGHDPQSLAALVTRTRVVCSTVGPFARHGTGLVAACASHGTHYCDITGEVQWIRRMIDAYEPLARKTGARIVHCCGFDSIPSDLGCLYIQQQMRARHGTPCAEVALRVKAMRGGGSGGTFASIINALEEARSDRDTRRIMADPYALNPQDLRDGPDGPDQYGVRWDPDVEAWTAPFVMAAINTRVVRRSNALMDFAYGRDFRYNEAMMMGRGPLRLGAALGVTAGLGGFVASASLAPTRALLNRFVLPQPGEGPSQEQRENGFFDMVLIGKGGEDGPRLRARVKGDRDPGYGSTSRMLAESAICLAMDGDELSVGGGIWTPASCLGSRLIERLQANAGLSFGLDD